MTESPHWNAPDDAFDPRCDDIDAALDAALDQSAPRESPEGLSQRVADASLPFLEIGRAASPARVAVPQFARLALAACLVIAAVVAFWIVGRQPSPRSIDDLHVRISEPDGFSTISERSPFERLRGLQMINELDLESAVGDLEGVVWAIQNGAASRMILSPGETPLEAVENELDLVRVVARLDG
ncbi:MAG: hypothetical protein GY894_06535 [Planctomycetes bacterium]|nr:hypothetical protein [Planctomycetota bacterium]MCP4839001.1 hypothetical protein [Planctomycetota bacterium]